LKEEKTVGIYNFVKFNFLFQELLKNRKMKEEDPRKDDQEVDDNSAAKKVGTGLH